MYSGSSPINVVSSSRLQRRIMSEQDLDSVEEEIAPQESGNDDIQHNDNEVQEADAVKEADAQERNWRAMRQRQKEMEWENQKLKEQNEWYAQKQAPQVVQEEEEEEISDEEYVSAGGVKGIARKTVRPLEKKIQDLEAKFAQQEQTKMVNSLRTKFTDFDDVVNVETLELLEKNEPEHAATIAEFKDPYKMGIQSYKYIKALGLVDKLPNSRRVKEVEKKIEQNSKTVQSPLAFDKRPMAQAFKSTAADKKRLYEEMMSYAGKASGL